MKKWLVVLVALLTLFTFSACNGIETETTVSELTVITISGLEDLNVQVGDEVDLLDGISAMGDDGVDYTDQMEVNSNCSINEGMLDTSEAGSCVVVYDATVGSVVAHETIDVTIEEIPDHAPVISGTNDVELVDDFDFDIMEGVSASDDEDGDLTDEINVTVTGPNDEETFDPTIAGVWTIVYSVTDSDDNTVTSDRLVTVVRENLLIGGDFDSSEAVDDWDVHEDGGGTISKTHEDGMMKLSVVSGNNPWEPRVSSAGIPFENGKTYRITVDAKASVEGKGLHVQVGEVLTESPWFVDFLDGNTKTYYLSTTMETYTFEFDMNIDSQNGSLLFELGNMTDSEDIDCDVFFDNIKIEEVRPMVVNGSFDEDMSGWDEYFAGMASISTSVVDGVAEIDVVSGENSWEPRITQMGMPFKQGNFYVISFDAKADEEGKGLHLQVGEILDESPYYTDFLDGDSEVFYLTTEWQTYEYLFYMETDNQNGGLLFEFGDVGDSVGIDTTVYLDNIEVANTNQLETDYEPMLEVGELIRDYEVGEADFDPEENVTALDVEDGDITDNVTMTVVGPDEETTFDDTIKGDWVFNYSVTDSDGHTVEAQTRIVITDPLVELMEPWRIYNFGRGTHATMYVKEGQMVVDMVRKVRQGLMSEDAISLIQDDLALDNAAGEENKGVFELENDSSYRISFDASYWSPELESGETYNIVVQVGYMDSSDTWVPYHSEDVSITESMDTYTVDFTIDSETDVTELAMLKIDVAGNTVFRSSVTFDNIRFEETDGTDVIPGTDIITDGSFDSTE